jgi:hypothetical protein
MTVQILMPAPLMAYLTALASFARKVYLSFFLIVYSAKLNPFAILGVKDVFSKMWPRYDRAINGPEVGFV